MQVYSRSQITENVLELVHFEDLPLGGEWRTRRRTITGADVAVFVGLSGDYNPLYVDVEHARGGHFGEPVVPGALVAAVTTGLGAIDVPVPATVGMVGMTWKFLRPVRPGDTIRSRWRLNRKRPVANPRWGLAVWQIEVENQRGELVATAEMTRLVSRREQAAEVVHPGKPARRRRRRGVPEAALAPELPPKPMPGPLREPLARPAAEGQWRGGQQPERRPAPEAAPPVEERQEPAAISPPSEPEPAPAVEAAAEPAPTRRRRRASGRSRPETAQEPVPEAPAAVEPAAPVPAEEPASPAPAARRRRRRPAAPEQVPPPPAPEPAIAPVPPAAEQAPPPPETAQPPPEVEPRPAPRRRRRSPRAAAPQPPDEAAPEQVVVTPEPAGEPPRGPELAAPETPPIPSPFRPPEGQADEEGGAAGLAGVLRRLRGGQ